MPLIVRLSRGGGRRGRGGAPACPGSRAAADPPPATPSDRGRRKRGRGADRRSVGHRIRFWSGRRRTPARSRAALRARARPAPPCDPDERDARRARSAGDRPGRSRSPSRAVMSPPDCTLRGDITTLDAQTPPHAPGMPGTRTARGPSKAKAAGHPAADRRRRGTAPPPRRRPSPDTPATRRPASRRERGTGRAVVAAVPGPREARRPTSRAGEPLCLVVAAHLPAPKGADARQAARSGAPAVPSLPLFPDRERPGGRPPSPGNHRSSSSPPFPWRPADPPPGKQP